jgi:hypothetical protein
VRELCEGLNELIAALLEREEGREVHKETRQPSQKP